MTLCKEKKTQPLRDNLARYGELLNLETDLWLIDPLHTNDKVPQETLHNINLMNQLLKGAFHGQAVWSLANIQRVRGGRVLSSRDAEEAASGFAPSATDFDVFSWRTYIMNYRTKNRIITLLGNDNISDGLREKPYQLRVLNLWLGNHQGEPTPRAQTLKQLLEAQIQMEHQVRCSFLAIDKRTEAINQLQKTAGIIEKLPLERLVVAFERVQERNVTQPLIEMDLLWQLDGKVLIQISDASQFPKLNEVLSVNLTEKINNMVLRRLPARLGQAYELYGRESINV
jgi:hypothetical protein